MVVLFGVWRNSSLDSRPGPSPDSMDSHKRASGFAPLESQSYSDLSLRNSMPNSTRNPVPNWICGGWKLPNFLNDTAQLGMWHRLIGYVAAGNFRISSMAQPNWKLWPGPSKFGERRLEARIAGICLAVFELGFGP